MKISRGKHLAGESQNWLSSEVHNVPGRISNCWRFWASCIWATVDGGDLRFDSSRHHILPLLSTKSQVSTINCCSDTACPKTSTIANSTMYIADLAVKLVLTFSSQVFSSRYLHYMLYLKEKSRIQWMYHRRDMRVTKIAPKVEISPIELSVKLQYLCPRKIFFRTLCADAHQTLASIRSMSNESNRETSIEQSLWESVVAYVRWLLSSFQSLLWAQTQWSSASSNSHSPFRYFDEKLVNALIVNLNESYKKWIRRREAIGFVLVLMWWSLTHVKRKFHASLHFSFFNRKIGR